MELAFLHMQFDYSDASVCFLRFVLIDVSLSATLGDEAINESNA